MVRHDRLNHAAVGSALTTGCAALTVEWRNCVTLYGIAYGIRSVRGCQSGNPTHVHCDLHRTYQLLVTATRNGACSSLPKPHLPATRLGMGATSASRAWDDARVRAVRAGAHARKRLPEVRAELVVHAVVPRPLPEASLYSPVAPTVLRPNDPAHAHRSAPHSLHDLCRAACGGAPRVQRSLAALRARVAAERRRTFSQRPTSDAPGATRKDADASKGRL